METELQRLASREVRIRDLRTNLVSWIHNGSLDLDAATADGDVELSEKSSREIISEGIAVPECISEVAELLLKQTELRQIEKSVSSDGKDSILSVITDLRNNLTTSIPTSDSILEQVIKSTINLKELTSSDFSHSITQLTNQLRSSTPTIDYFTKLSEDHYKSYTTSKTNGEFAIADQHLGDQSDVLCELNHLYQERVGLTQLSTNLDDTVLSDIDMSHSKFSSSIRDFKIEYESKLMQLSDDLEKINDSRDQHILMAEKSLSVLNSDLDDNNEKISENTAEHQQVLSDLNLLARRMSDIGDRRSTLVENHLKMKKEHSVIRSQTQAITNLHEQHQSFLTHLQGKLKSVVDNAKDLQQNGNEKIAMVRQTISSSQEKIMATLKTEQQGHLTCFQKLYESLKLRLFTLANRFEELQEASKAAHWRMTMSQNTLDHAGVTGCMINIKDITSIKEDVMAASAKIVAKLQKAISDVKESLCTESDSNVASEIDTFISEVDAEYENKTSKIGKERAEALAAGSEQASRLALESFSPTIPAVERSRDDRVKAALHTERLQNFISSPNDKGSPRSHITQSPVVQYYEGVGSPQRSKLDEGGDRESYGENYKFKPYAAIRSKSRGPETGRESNFSTPRELSNSYRSGPQMSSPHSPILREPDHRQQQQHYWEPATSRDRSISQQVPLNNNSNTRPGSDSYSQSREPSYRRSVSQQPVDKNIIPLNDSQIGSPEYRFKTGGDDNDRQRQVPPESHREMSEPSAAIGYLGRRGLEEVIPSYSRAGISSLPRQLSTERSPSISNMSLSMANCEDLRKRAEQLRKAAEETRRRAQAHRDQANAISPRRPHISS